MASQGGQGEVIYLRLRFELIIKSAAVRDR